MKKKKVVCISLASVCILSIFFWHQDLRIFWHSEPSGTNYQDPRIFWHQEPRAKNLQLIQVYERDSALPIIGYNSMLEVCDSFEYIPSEWILTQKKEFRNVSESSRCVALREQIFETNRVKWVIHPNETIENLGCTRDTPKCDPGPHFDAVRNIRINTPPCCRQKMLFVFEILTKGLQQLNIPHMLFYGGVIGWARNHQMIPYDKDLDMVINGTFWRSAAMMRFLEDISEKYGFVVSWRGDKENFGVTYSKNNGNKVDVWSYRMVGWWRRRLMLEEKIHVKHYNSPYEWDYDVINPPRQVTFNGIQTYVPNKPVEYVDQTYGEGTWKWREKLCKNATSEDNCLQ